MMRAQRAEHAVKRLEALIMKLALIIADNQHNMERVNELVGELSLDFDRLDAAKARLRNERARETRARNRGKR